MMMTRTLQIRANLKRLALAHAAAIETLEETIAMLQAELDALSAADEVSTSCRSNTESEDPILDRSTFCVSWRGHRCHLGNTLSFRFLECLSRRQDRYFSHAWLLDAVWGGERSPDAIRSVVKELRAKLTRAGMSALARAIDGRTPGHYGLKDHSNG